MKNDGSPQKVSQLRPFAISHSFDTLKGDGGTSAIFNFMALLTIFNDGQSQRLP